MSEKKLANIAKGVATSPWILVEQGQPMPVQTVPVMRMKMNNFTIDWQTHCGVRGPFTKYQEEYRALGNPKRVEAVAHKFRDRSYEANAKAVSRMLIGLYVR